MMTEHRQLGQLINYSIKNTKIQSQNVGGSRYSLFRVYTRSHGSDVNEHFKINILNVKDFSKPVQIMELSHYKFVQ